jgi:hypothetical protein
MKDTVVDWRSDAIEKRRKFLSLSAQEKIQHCVFCGDKFGPNEAGHINCGGRLLDVVLPEERSVDVERQLLTLLQSLADAGIEVVDGNSQIYAYREQVVRECVTAAWLTDCDCEGKQWQEQVRDSILKVIPAPPTDSTKEETRD